MRRSVSDHMGRKRHARNNQTSESSERPLEIFMWWPEMSLTAKLLAAAGIGGAATYLMNGDWSRKAKARAIASSAFGWAFGAVVFHLFPSLTAAPDEAKMGVVCICCGFAGYLFDRVQRISITANIGGVNLKSEGNDEKDKLP